MKLLLFSISFFSFLSASSQKDAERLFSVSELLADYDSAYSWIKAIHPKLYSNADSLETEKAWKASRKNISRPMTDIEFCRIISPLVHQYNDGHTFIDKEFNHPTFDSFRKSSGLLFPLPVKIFGDTLVVKFDSSYSIESGSTIIAINNVPATEVLKQVKKLMSADYTLNLDFSCSRLFSHLLWWSFQWKGNYLIHYRTPSGKQKTTTIEGISVDEYFKRIFPSPLWSMQLYPTESLAVIECNNYGGNMTRIREKLDSFFAVIKQKNIKHVALDLRRNGGGNSYIGDIFLSYVTKKSYAAIQSKSFRQSWAIDSLPETDFRKPEIEKFKAEAENINGFLVATYKPAPPIPLAKPELYFEGKFYLITCPRTYSSAHMTALQVKCAQIGTIIGQPTGEQVDLTGEIKGFPLPKTKLPLWIPMAMYKAACPMEKKLGVQPDFYVPSTIDDVIKNRDAEVEFLKQHIHRNQ